MNAFNKLVDISITGAQAVLTGFAYLQILALALLVIGVLAVVVT